MKLKEVRESALALSLRSRAKLATDLIRSLKRDAASGLERTDAEWEDEIQRRIAAMESGEDPGIPLDEFLKRIQIRADEHSGRKGRAARL
jgi:putative addiction module component (TIGR02574 family)